MKTYIIRLENEDDIIFVQDKISWSKANRVLLVWPPHGRILERRLDLLLLLRHSQEIGAQLALVTRQSNVISLARELGIPVFESIEKAQRTPWRKPRTQRAGQIPERRRLRDTTRLRSAREALEHPKEPRLWLRILMFGLGIGAILALGLFFVPSAEVRLTPMRKPQQITLNVWAGPEIQTPHPSGGIPAQVLSVTVEGRDQSPSTSVTLVPDGYATGAVQLRNLTDQPVDVPEGSVMVTLSHPPIRFSVTQPVQVAAGPGKTVIAPIRAEAPGSESNLPAGLIQAMEGPLGLRLVVENIDPTWGGTDRTSPAPSESDYRSLREKLLIKLQESALADLKSNLSPDQRLLVGTLRREDVVEETREPSQGQPGDQLQLAMRVTFDAWVVKDADLQTVAVAGLDANLPSGFQPVPDSLKITFIDEPQLDPPGIESQQPGGATRASWRVDAERTLEAGWTDLALFNALRGQTLSGAREVLQSGVALAEPPEITVYPAFWQRMPYLPARITLIKQ